LTGAPGDLQGMLGFPQRSSSRVEECSSGSCEFDPWRSHEQRKANNVLQPLDLLTQGWLGDAESRGGSTEVQLFGDSNEVPEVTKFRPQNPHMQIISYMNVQHILHIRCDMLP
jgi:hypothetical protein